MRICNNRFQAKHANIQHLSAKEWQWSVLLQVDTHRVHADSRSETKSGPVSLPPIDASTFDGGTPFTPNTANMLLQIAPSGMFDNNNGAMVPAPDQQLTSPVHLQQGHHGVEPYFSMSAIPAAQTMIDMHHSPMHPGRRESVTMHSMDPTVSMFPDDSSLGDFLTDIMMPITPSAMDATLGVGFMPQSYTPRDVLDFGADRNYDFNDFSVFDFGFISQYKEPQSRPFQQHIMVDGGDSSYPPSRPPEMEDGQAPDINNIGIEAFKKSLWSKWAPTKAEHGSVEQINLSLPFKDIQASAVNEGFELRLCEERLDQTCRDRIMAMLFGTCEPAVIPKIVSSFPSAELLDSLMQQYICVHMSQLNAWIHLPTFRPNQSRPEFIGIIIATGAILSPLPALRKLGSAIQEAVRLALPKTVRSSHYSNHLH